MAKVRYNDDDYLIFFENKNSYLKQIHNFLAEPRYDLEVKNENILFKEKFPKEMNFLNITLILLLTLILIINLFYPLRLVVI